MKNFILIFIIITLNSVQASDGLITITDTSDDKTDTKVISILSDEPELVTIMPIGDNIIILGDQVGNLTTIFTE